MARIIEEDFTPTYFCPFDGDIYEKSGVCTKCQRDLVATTIYRVKRVCGNCGEVFEATKGYFDNNSDCPSCDSGILIPPSPKSTHHFIFDGSWDGKPRDKVIREKNEQLKKKHAGYSYETPKTLREKTEAKYGERRRKKGM